MKLRNWLKLVSLICLVAGILLVGTTGLVWAHTFDYSYTFYDMDENFTDTTIHDDSEVPIEEAKGSATITITNNTGIAWGDFHFGIGWSDAIFDPDETPLMNGTPFDPGDFVLSSGNTILDLYFYSTPVYSGQQVSFTIYTDNTATGGIFGMCFYPTPVVPIPSAVWLFGSALIGLVGIRKRLNK